MSSIPTKLPPLLPLIWVGSSRRDCRALGKPATDLIGIELQRIQLGVAPTNWKPMKTVGPGVREVRVSCSGEFRVFYVAIVQGKPAVLHVFQKKTQQTSQRDIEIGRQRLKELRVALK